MEACELYHTSARALPLAVKCIGNRLGYEKQFNPGYEAAHLNQDSLKLSPGGSILLDVLRFGAACAVLLSHFGHNGISTGFPDFDWAGHHAVAVFFVLSGFVIRYVSLTRETNAKEYFKDRASRIYSVAVPALLLTIVCELAASHLSPGYYALVRTPFLWRQIPLQLLLNLSFQAQDWGYTAIPLSNVPFWSLSFECFYYVLYGVMFYKVPGKTLWCFLLLLIAGPSIALMFPVWLLGCLAFDLYKRLSAHRFGLAISSSAFAAILGILFTSRLRIRALLEATDQVHRTEWLSRSLSLLPHHGFVAGTVPWLENASTSFALFGLLVAAAIIWGILLLDRCSARLLLPAGRWIRVLADSTFALYLLHWPLLILIVCALGKPIRGWPAFVLTLSLVIGGCAAAAVPMDAFKRLLRGRSRSTSGSVTPGESLARSSGQKRSAFAQPQ